MYKAITQPRFYGKKYLSAKTTNELLLLLGEACSAAAFPLVEIFDLPRRGSLVLKSIKVFSKKSYDRHIYLYNFTFSHCIFYIARKFHKTVEHTLGAQSQDIALEVCGLGSACMASLANYSEEDRDALSNELRDRLNDYPIGTIIDEETLFQNIIKEIGQDIRTVKTDEFFIETKANDPLSIVEPFRFCDKYLMLIKS